MVFIQVLKIIESFNLNFRKRSMMCNKKCVEELVIILTWKILESLLAFPKDTTHMQFLFLL